MNEQLKPFDKVLVRRSENNEWVCDLYSHYDSDTEYHICAGGRYDYCIPYEGNEHLLGTTDAPKQKRWRAEKGEGYWSVGLNNCLFTGVCIKERGQFYNDNDYNTGNYFRTEEEARAMADKFKAMLKGGFE